MTNASNFLSNWFWIVKLFLRLKFVKINTAYVMLFIQILDETYCNIVIFCQFSKQFQWYKWFSMLLTTYSGLDFWVRVQNLKRFWMARKLAWNNSGRISDIKTIRSETGLLWLNLVLKHTKYLYLDNPFSWTLKEIENKKCNNINLSWTRLLQSCILYI